MTINRRSFLKGMAAVSFVAALSGQKAYSLAAVKREGAPVSYGNLERWKLADAATGTFEYIGNEPFDGYLSADFTTTRIY